MGAGRQHQGGSGLTLLGDVLFGADALVAQWVAERVPSLEPSPGARGLGVQKGGRMAAGVLYERWNGVHCEVSIAVDDRARWASRRTLFALFYFPFVTLDCRAISVCVPASNLASLNLATKLGFAPEAIVKLAAHDGGDLVILKQWRENCRWLHHGQEQRATERA